MNILQTLIACERKFVFFTNSKWEIFDDFAELNLSVFQSMEVIKNQKLCRKYFKSDKWPRRHSRAVDSKKLQLN